MSKAILIDVAAREVREIAIRTGEANGLADLHTHIGGYIESAWVWNSGDVLYVDEEGLSKPQRHFFRLAQRGAYPFAGNGVVVGPEECDEDGEYTRTLDTTRTVAELRAAVTFLTREQADAWAKGNASDPAATFLSVGPDGRVETEVIARMGRVFADMPKPADPEIVGTLGTHPRYPGRLAILHPDGALSNTFGLGETRDEVATLLRRLGMELRDDNSIIRREGSQP